MTRDDLPEPLSPRQLLLLGVWAGLLGGLGEVVVLAVVKFLFHRFLFRSVDVVWTAPVSLAILCALVALPLALVARLKLGARIPWIVLPFLAILNLSPQILRGLHPVAWLLLVMGLAVQLGNQAFKRSDRVLRLAGRTLAPLLLLVGFLAVAVRGGIWISERRALAALPAADQDAPNILFLILDTVRAMDLSLHGYSRATSPMLERLGRQGAVFDRAYAPSSWTLPSHVSMFTGHRAAETGVGFKTPYDGRYPTLAEHLSRRGYSTAGFVANLPYVSRESGLSRGFTHWEDYPIDAAAVLEGSAVTGRLGLMVRRRLLQSFEVPGRKSGRRLAGDLLSWLDRRTPNRPFFGFLNYYDAHNPYLPPAPFDSAFTGRIVPPGSRNLLLEHPHPVSMMEATDDRDAYDQAIASQDHEIGLLLDAMERRGLLRNTIIVVTSDHGEEFGEFGLLNHGGSLYPASLWVPLVVVFPGRVLEGVRLTEAVSLVDLPRTILSLAIPAHAGEMPGRILFGAGNSSLNPARSPAVAELSYELGMADWIPASRGPLRSVTDSAWHFVVNGFGEETLMDIRTDPAGRVLDPKLGLPQAPLRTLRATIDSVSPPDRIARERQPTP